MSPARKPESRFHAAPGYWITFALTIVLTVGHTFADALARLAALEARVASLQEQNDVQNARLSALERGGHQRGNNE